VTYYVAIIIYLLLTKKEIENNQIYYDIYYLNLRTNINLVVVYYQDKLAYLKLYNSL